MNLPTKVGVVLLLHEDLLQALLTQPILLYVFDQSPYYKHSYTSPDINHVHAYVNEQISNLWDVNPSWMMDHKPRVVRLLQAERLVISEYRSPDQLYFVFIEYSVFSVLMIERILQYP